MCVCVWRKDVRVLTDSGLTVSRSGLVLQVGKHLNSFVMVLAKHLGFFLFIYFFKLLK